MDADTPQTSSSPPPMDRAEGEGFEWWHACIVVVTMAVFSIWTAVAYRRKRAEQLDAVAAAERAAAAHVGALRSQYDLGQLCGGWLLRASEAHPRGKGGGRITVNYEATLQLHFAVRAAARSQAFSCRSLACHGVEVPAESAVDR